ncbi:phage tail protein [Lysinibacillus sp. LZ02]|uniref:phage tail protein n=1 Tax=Lysinibacillus sp. LZ02 TaxID=3420668 RepID=UPI003D3606C9
MAENASPTTKGHVQLSSATNSASETLAATPRAVKLVNDSLDSHVNKLFTDSNGVHGLKIETGNFTPYFYGSTTSGTNTYVIQSGIYYKIANLVKIDLIVQINVKGTMTGNLEIGGLPFVAKAEAHCCFGGYALVNLGDYSDLLGTVVDTKITLKKSGNNKTEARIVPDDIVNQSFMKISATYTSK